MEKQAEDLYIVVGALGEMGAHYRQAFSRQPGAFCVGLERSRSRHVHWDSRDKGLLGMDLCKTYDDGLRKALQSLIDTRYPSLPSSVTVLFAAGRNGGKEYSPYGGERRRQPEMPCFNALALKNIVSMLEEIIEARAEKEQKPVFLRVVALTHATTPRTTMEAFVAKFVSSHDQRRHPYIAKSGLVARAQDDISPEDLVAATLPRILCLRDRENALLDVSKPATHIGPWRSPSGINGLPDETQWQNMLQDRDGVPRRLWSSIIRTRRWREEGKIGARSGS